jgi:hypothetical protein
VTTTGAIVKSSLISLSLLVVSASSAQPQKDSVLVYEKTIRTSIGLAVLGETVMRIGVVESPLGIRNELLESKGPPGAMMGGGGSPFLKHPGNYIVSLASGATYVVDPEAREYFVLELPADSSAEMQALDAFGANVDSKSNNEIDSLGEGALIGGQPNSHWRIHQVSRITMRTGNDSVVSGSDLTTDSYFATAIPRLAPERLRDPETRDSGNRKLPPNLELKSLRKGTISMPGMAVPLEISTEVTRVEKKPLDREVFSIPKGYKKVEMPFPAPPQRNF